MTKAKETKVFKIAPAMFEQGELTLQIEAIPGSTLIINKTSEETLAGISDKSIGKTVEKVKYESHEEAAKAKLHLIGEVVVFPVSGIYKGMNRVPKEAKKAANASGPILKGITCMGDITTDMMRIKYKEKALRVDHPRNKENHVVSNPRYEFKEWSATVKIRFDVSLISPQQVIYLINKAGLYAGLGSWAPHCPSGGSHGLYRVTNNQQVK